MHSSDDFFFLNKQAIWSLAHNSFLDISLDFSFLPGFATSLCLIHGGAVGGRGAEELDLEFVMPQGHLRAQKFGCFGNIQPNKISELNSKNKVEKLQMKRHGTKINSSRSLLYQV